jgi:hypothetical protein
LWFILALLVLGLASGQPALADTVTTFTTNGSSCSGCPAASYELIFDNTSGNLFTVTLMITYSGSATITSGDNQVSAVSFDMGTLTGLGTLTTAPGGASNWTTSQNGISSSNSAASCTNNGANFECSMQNFNGSGQLLDLAGVTQGGTLEWQWTDATGTLTPGDFHIGAKYNSTNCMSDGTNCTSGLIISDSTGGNTSNAPEPGSMAMLGTGLFAVAGLVRRRRSKS